MPGKRGDSDSPSAPQPPDLSPLVPLGGEGIACCALTAAGNHFHAPSVGCGMQAEVEKFEQS